MIHLRTRFGLAPWRVEMDRLPWFRFGNSQQCQATGCFDVPVGLKMRVFAIIRVFVVPGGAPRLLSNRLLRVLKLVCDFDEDSFYCKVLGCHLTVEILSTGHYLLRLDEFPQTVTWSRHMKPLVASPEIYLYHPQDTEDQKQEHKEHEKKDELEMQDDKKDELELQVTELENQDFIPTEQTYPAQPEEPPRPPDHPPDCVQCGARTVNREHGGSCGQCSKWLCRTCLPRGAHRCVGYEPERSNEVDVQELAEMVITNSETVEDYIPKHFTLDTQKCTDAIEQAEKMETYVETEEDMQETGEWRDIDDD
jgi:hypothetical protein